MAKKVQLMTNPKQWQVIDGVEVLVDVPQEDIDPITDSSCVEIEGHRTLEETISQENMFTPQITETKVSSKVGGVYHDNVVDGAYEEAILYGNTQVNLVESVTTGTKYIPHSFTSFQGNESKIGNYYSGRTNQVAPLVKGVTMVNLCQKTSVTIAEGHNGGAIENIKSNTEYTLALDFTVQNTQKGFSIQSFKDDTYLETSMIRIGMGEKVEFTFTTHGEANRIYIVNNSGYGGEIQLDNIMVIEGDVTDLDLPFFKGIRSVELSRPLTNLFTDDLQVYSTNSTATNSGGNVTVTSTTVSSWNASQYYLKGLKQNTKYIAMWDSLTTTQTATTQQEILVCVVSVQDNVKLGGINEDEKCPTLRSIIFDTRDKPLNEIAIRIHASMSNSEATTTTVTGLRVFEWDDSLRTLDLQTIGYFSGTKYVSARALETEGKNLYPYGDINFTPTLGNAWHDAKGNAYMTGDIAEKSKSRFLLKKGTYKFTVGNTSNCSYQLVDDKEQLIASAPTFNLTQDTYCTIRIKTIEANVATTATNIQIERGETATTYEVYQSRYYKPRETEEIILRSLPNGVCDTFNLQTGELVQNIGVAIYDGSDDELWGNDGVDSNNIPYFTITKSLPAIYSTNKLMYNCDIYKPCLDIDTDKIAITTTHYGLMLTGNNYIRIKNGTTTREEFMASLKEKPVTLIYALKEPIITKLQTYDRIYNGQKNILTDMGNNLSALTYRYSTDYLKVANLSPIPAILEPITSIPYDVRLKPSTLYTVKYNRGGNSSSMSFDLGGSVVEKTNLVTDSTGIAEELTVRTPAILSHEQLILSGTGFAHNFIVVEGDITGTELPYFEGMKDVKMPIVKNISRNLLNESSMRVFYESNIVIRTYDVFPCKPNTRYCFVSVGGETSCNWHVCKKDAHYERPENESVGIIQYLGYSREIVTPQDCYYMCIHTGSNPTTDKEVYDIKTAIYEGSFAECVNYGYEDYKENSVYAVQGEYPITSEMIEQGGFSTASGKNIEYEIMKYNNAARLRSKDLIPVKPNTTYAFTHSFSKFGYNVYQWNGNKRFIDGTSQYFASGQIETITTTADTQYIHFLMSKHDASQAITVSEYDWSQFHMYELDSTINLRSLPNGVKDELNLLTGEYIQRVGEVVLDGSDDEDWNVYTDGDFALTPFFHITFFNWLDGGSCTNKYHNAIKISSDGELGYCIYGNGVSNNIPRAILRVRTNEIVNGLTIESWKEELKISPLILQYKLAEPIISHVRLVSNNQEREVGVKLPYGVSNTYNPSTGITTVRVGKVVLDGSEEYSLHKTSAQTTVWYTSNPLPNVMNFSENTSVVAEGINAPYPPKSLENQTQEVCYISSTGKFNFTLLNTKASTVNELKTYLASNPITVWYELKYPQIQPDIVLPNGVHDEYNPETGAYTKRVGFVEFNGSEDWYAGIESGGLQQAANGAIDMYGAWTKEPLANARPASDAEFKIPGVCDTFSFKNAMLDQTNEEFYFISTSGRFNMNIARTKLTGSNVSHLKTYLSQNPIKLWYELQTPITYKLTPYFGLPQPYAYEDGYLIHDSAYAETTLPPEFKYKLVANRTGQVMQNSRKLQEHTTRLSNLEAIIIEATIESLFNRELQLFELELMDIQLIDLGE